MTQHVVEATRGENVLDLLLTPASDNDTLSQVAVRSTCFSDHNLVTCRLHVPLNSPTISRYCYRDICRFDLAAFHSVIQQSALYDFHSTTSVDSYVELFNSKVERILDKHAPLKSRTCRVSRHDCRWLSADALEAKRRCRRRER